MAKCCIEKEELYKAALVEIKELSIALRHKQQVRDAAMQALGSLMRSIKDKVRIEKMTYDKLRELRREVKRLNKSFKEVTAQYVPDDQQRHLVYKAIKKLFKELET